MELKRETYETEIYLNIDFDKNYFSQIDTSIGFLDHMLNTLAKYLNISLKIKAKGDTHVDYHHLIEDIGIILGKALRKEIDKDKKINRFGNTTIPMDDSLILIALDLSGRSFLNYSVDFKTKQVGNIPLECFEEFFLKFTNNAQMNLHIKKLSGKNSHHIIENIFKALGVSLKQALTKSDSLLTTKGKLGD